MQDALIDRIRAAHADHRRLVIRGHGSKAFYGNPVAGEPLDTTPLIGVIDYQPQELVLTARAGTPLAEIEALLAENGQMLPFEPPRFGPHPNPLPPAGEGANDAHRAPGAMNGTLGGAIATGLSGPRRAYAGAARDFVLGVRLVDGTGQALRFGGQVIKNVAGYDVSRLMAGALGTLGLITEISLKVLPRPAAETSLQFECAEAEAIRRMNEWAGRPLPLSATSWHAGLLAVRLSGAASAVRAAQAKLGGEPLHDADGFWLRLRDQTTPFFDAAHFSGEGPPGSNRNLWRLAVNPTAAPLSLGDAQWIEAGGGVRWLAADAPPAALREAARRHGGHATLFRGDALADGNFAPLAPALAALHGNLKRRFDPHGVFNRGRLYPEF